jgi:predicted heme/steroid binding protein
LVFTLEKSYDGYNSNLPPAFQARHEDQNLTTYSWGDGERFALFARGLE